MGKEFEPTDFELLCSLKQGDEMALDFIFDRYWKSLYNLAHDITKSAAFTEEIVQEVFIDLWQYRNEIPLTDALDYLTELTGKKLKEKKFINVSEDNE